MSNLAPTQQQFPINFAGIEKESNVINTSSTVLKTEYLSGGYIGSEQTLRILSHNRDAWAGELTDAVIKEILKDPEVYKCLAVIKNGVLGDGVTFSPALSLPIPIEKPLPGEPEPEERRKERIARDQQIERYNLSKQYADFATRAFNNLEVSIGDVLDDMLEAIAYGNRTAEKIFEPKFDKELNDTKLYLKRLNVKPREDVIFVTDKFRNLIGLKAYQTIIDEEGRPITKPVVIKKEKFAILTFGSKNNDPRGTSFLESIYKAWQLKQELWPEYLRWLVYSAVPPIVGYASGETDSRKVLRNADGDIVTDTEGRPVYESDVGALIKALSEVRNASAIAVPYGAKVETLNSSVSGDPFKGLRDVLNEEIEMGLIHQTLATSDSRHNTRAASQTHATILDELIWKIKGVVTAMLIGIVKHLMEINFPEFDASLVPVISMGDTARRDFRGDVGAISQLSISGFIGESQKDGIDRILGLPPRDSYSDREFEKQQALEKLKLVEMAKLMATKETGTTTNQNPPSPQPNTEGQPSSTTTNGENQ